MGSGTAGLQSSSAPLLCSLSSAAVAEFCCYPIDSVKTWLQLSQRVSDSRRTGPFDHVLDRSRRPSVLSNIATVVVSSAERGGVQAFFQGVTLAVARNALSTMCVIGFAPTVSSYVADFGVGPLTTKVCVSSSLSLIANTGLIPLETIKIRLQGDGRMLPEDRRFASPLTMFRGFIANYGAFALWAGALPTYLRSALWWAVSVPVYTEAKNNLIERLGFSDGPSVHMLASVLSGLSATIISQPADMVKTRLQNQSQKQKVYAGTWDCAVQVARKDGVLSLFRGLLPRYGRLGPWQIIFFVMYEHTLMLTTGQSYGSIQ